MAKMDGTPPPTFNPEEADNLEDMEKQFAVKGMNPTRMGLHLSESTI